MTRNFYSTHVIIDLETLEIVARDIVPYSGPWVLAEGAPVPPVDAGTPPASGDSGPASSGDPLQDYVDGAPDTPAPTDAQPQPSDGQPQEPKDGAQPQDGQAQPQPTPQDAAADKTLKAVYRENAGNVKEFVKQHPELRPAFFKGAELSELFTTVEDGKQAKEWATQLYNFDNLYYSNSPNDKRAFIQSLYDNSLEADGTSPHFDQVASIFVGDGLSNLAERIQKGDSGISRAFADLGLNGKQAMVAVQAVAAMFGIPLQGVKFSAGASSPQPGSNGQPNLSEREQYLANEVSRLQAEINEGRNNALAQSEQTFYDGAKASFDTNLAGMIDKALEPATGLKNQKIGFQNWVKSEVGSRVRSALHQDQFFANQMDALSRSGNRGPEHQRSLVAAFEQRARYYLPDILSSVLADAGITIAKNNANGAQAGPVHREPASSGTPGRLTRPGTTPASKAQPGESYEQYSRRVLGIE